MLHPEAKKTSSTSDSFDLSERVAIVIGGTGILGSAMARGLVQAGANVAIAGRNRIAGQRHVDEWNGASSADAAAYFQTDATQSDEIERLRDAVHERFGRIDILVNSAGVNDDTPFFDVSSAEWRNVFDVNLTAIFNACQIMGQYMIRQGRGGSIINIGSMAGIRPLSRVFAYSASKAALTNLSLNLAREWGPERIRVNVLAPGFFPAEQNRRILTQDRIDAILGHTPMARFGDPDELVGAAIWLSSEKAASFVTGAVIPVDGGFSAMSI